MMKLNLLDISFISVDDTWTGLNGKDGNVYKNGAGVSLRPQGYPDAVNHFRDSPGAVLHPGNVYIHTTSYKFGVMKGAKTNSTL